MGQKVYLYIPEISEFSEDTFHSGDNVVHEPARDPLVHGGVLLTRGLHVQELDQGLDGDSLNKDGPIDHGDCRRDEHGGVGNGLKEK